MPAGNDALEAQRELYGQYGVHSNASELIRAHQASIDPAVQQLGLLGIDAEATAEYKDQDGWAAAAAKQLELPEGSTVLDLAVRGNGLSVVYTDAFGDTHKAAGAANDNYVPPKLTPQQASIRAQAQADAEVNAEIAALRAQGNAKLEAFQAELDAATAEAIAKAQEKADEAVAKAAEDAESDDAEAEPKPKSTRRGAAKS